MESRRNGPQPSTRHVDDDEGLGLGPIEQELYTTSYFFLLFSASLTSLLL